MIRADVSQKNTYWIPKHRYYELKHFCMQYPDWKKALLYLDEVPKSPNDIKTFTGNVSDPTGKLALKRSYFSKKINMVDEAAKASDDVIGDYILLAVINGKSYDYMRMHFSVPCGKDLWYEIYRRFFYCLHTIKD